MIADDDPVLRQILPHQLGTTEFSAYTAATAKQAVDMAKEIEFDVVLLDINLPDFSGLQALPELRGLEYPPEVIMLTADESLQTGLEAMRRGAYEYLTKPANLEQVEAVIIKAAEKRSLAQQNERLRAVFSGDTSSAVTEPVHHSAAMRQIFSQAEIAARTDSTVLVTGESGTGKDVLARWIHSRSPRARQPFMSINCGAMPESLIESEFFGHEKGAFTGANAKKVGLFEAADRSTLFLDEIGEMPLSIQVKLLHFLEHGVFRRVGGTRDNFVDARVIAATNRPLAEDVKDGKFREDLFYRLNVIAFEIPPLRDRREDIPALIEHFTGLLRQRLNRPTLQFSQELRERLQGGHWRGNIRELRNTLERAAVLSQSDRIEALPIEIAGDGSPTGKTTTVQHFAPLPLAEIEQKHILEVLEMVGGKREKAAAILGITARTLYRKLNEFKQSGILD